MFRVKKSPPNILTVVSFEPTKNTKTSFCQAAGLNLAGISALCFSTSWSPGVFKERSNSKTSGETERNRGQGHPSTPGSEPATLEGGQEATFSKASASFTSNKRVVTTKSPNYTKMVVSWYPCLVTLLLLNKTSNRVYGTGLFLQINEPK